MYISYILFKKDAATDSTETTQTIIQSHKSSNFKTKLLFWTRSSLEKLVNSS